MQELIGRLNDLVEALSEGNVTHADVARQQIRINGMYDLLAAMQDRMYTLRARTKAAGASEDHVDALWEKA